jgi:peptide/nickel transport system permease protein
MGYGRFLIVRGVNILIVLFIVVAVLVALFHQVLRNAWLSEIDAAAREQARTQCEQLAAAGRPCSTEERLRIQDEFRETLIKVQGLDKPWYYHLFNYMYRLMTLKGLEAKNRDIITQTKDVFTIIAFRIRNSILLFTIASIINLLIALPLGLFVANRPGGIADNAVSLAAILSASLPWWWFAMIMIYLFAFNLRWFQTPGDPTVNWYDPWSVLTYARLPILTLVILGVGSSTFIIRNMVITTMQEDFVTTARAKGLPEKDVLLKHVLRAAAPPIATMVILSIGLSMVGGAMITEVIFQWNGLGLLYRDALLSGGGERDVNLIVGLTYITTLVYLLLRFFLDILYGILDPRIRVR